LYLNDDDFTTKPEIPKNEQPEDVSSILIQ